MGELYNLFTDDDLDQLVHHFKMKEKISYRFISFKIF